MYLVSLVAIVIVGIYLLFDRDMFHQLMAETILAPIQWDKVERWQLYLAWSLTAIYVGVGLAGLGYLSQVFKRFGKDELFSLANSRCLRDFTSCLLLQSFSSPLYFGLFIELFTFNNPAGLKNVNAEYLIW